MYALVNPKNQKEFLDAYAYQAINNCDRWKPLDKYGNEITKYNTVNAQTLFCWVTDGCVSITKKVVLKEKRLYPRVFKDCSIEDWFWYVFNNPNNEKTLLSWDSTYGVRPDPKYRAVDKYETDGSLIEVFGEERAAALQKLIKDFDRTSS